jgi:hypothetical protein
MDFYLKMSEAGRKKRKKEKNVTVTGTYKSSLSAITVV